MLNAHFFGSIMKYRERRKKIAVCRIDFKLKYPPHYLGPRIVWTSYETSPMWFIIRYIRNV